MNSVKYSFVLTLLAGLSSIFGYFIIYAKGNKEKIISLSLSFASGVMITISIIDLMPSSFNYFTNFYILFRLIFVLFFIILGIFVSFGIDKSIPNNNINNRLYKLGFLAVLSIIIHNIPEGIVTFMVSNQDRKIGLSLAIAIGMHNIPEGISIAIPLYYSTKNKFKTFMIIVLAGMSEFLGALLCYFFLEEYLSNFIIGIIFSVTAGIMLNIGINLWREALQYSKKITVIGFIIGIFIMLVSMLLI